MARAVVNTDRNFDLTHYANEDDLKADKYSVEIKSPKIKENIRDKSCVIIFPRNTNENRLNRVAVTELMKIKWGPLFNHVVHFGNVDFSRKWVFCFDTHENNETAITKEIFVNNQRIKAYHATKKFNYLKIDWVPPYTDLEDLATIISNVEGVTGKFVDIRWARGDKIEKDSTQVILRFYAEPNVEFNPPSYVHYNDEYGYRVFLHLTIMGGINKCMRCNREGHIVVNCPFFFCHGCGKLTEKDNHNCKFQKYNRQQEKNFVYKEKSVINPPSPKNMPTPMQRNISYDAINEKEAKSPVSFRDALNKGKKEKIDNNVEKENMQILKKKSRTPPTPPQNPKTPIYPYKKVEHQHLKIK